MTTVTTVKQMTRPTTDVDFYKSADSYRGYFHENYIMTGKVLSSDQVLSEDKLTITTTTMWKDQQAFADFMSDSVCYNEHTVPNRIHDYKNNIKSASSFNGSSFSANGRIWKKFNPDELFSDLDIPDDWNSLEDFVDWYISKKIPIMIPWSAEVIRSDDAVAICVFRKGHYQVEFYLEYPNMHIVPHAHPRMEVITMDLGGGGLGPIGKFGMSQIWGQAYEKLPAGDTHGGDSTTLAVKGFVTLAFQRWEDPAEMTSAAVQWKGGLQGPHQAELIRRKKKKALVDDNYADVTNDTSVTND